MIYAVIFKDDPTFSEMRSRYMEEHLSFLMLNSEQILFAGPLIKNSDREPEGGLWIVEAENVDVVERLVEQDPFRHTGLRKVIRTYIWKQVFADGKRLI